MFSQWGLKSLAFFSVSIPPAQFISFSPASHRLLREARELVEVRIRSDVMKTESECVRQEMLLPYVRFTVSHFDDADAAT